MGGFSVMLIFGFFIVSYHGQVSANWVDELTRDLNQMQQQIHQRVNSQLAQVNQNVEQAIKNANEAAANANFSQSNNRLILGNSGAVTFHQGTGIGDTIRKVWYGKDKDGNSFYKDVDVFNFVDKFYQVERTYNATTKKLEIKILTRDPNDPNAELVPVSSCEN